MSNVSLSTLCRKNGFRCQQCVRNKNNMSIFASDNLHFYICILHICNRQSLFLSVGNLLLFVYWCKSIHKWFLILVQILMELKDWRSALTYCISLGCSSLLCLHKICAVWVQLFIAIVYVIHLPSVICCVEYPPSFPNSIICCQLVLYRLPS